jgi:hypothetical protein
VRKLAFPSQVIDTIAMMTMFCCHSAHLGVPRYEGYCDNARFAHTRKTTKIDENITARAAAACVVT